jgi:hypothetical protein
MKVLLSGGRAAGCARVTGKPSIIRKVRVADHPGVTHARPHLLTFIRSRTYDSREWQRPPNP